MIRKFQTEGSSASNSRKQAMCEGKGAMSYEQATTAARRINRKKGGNASAFKCKECGAWHVGNTNIEQGEAHRKYLQETAEMNAMSKNMEIRPSAIKSYSVEGVRYVYHRATGDRLPDLPFDHPDFRVAFAAAEASLPDDGDTQPLLVGLQEVSRKIEPGEVRLRRTPSSVAYNAEQVRAFAIASAGRDILVYHAGDLAIDAHKSPDVAEKQRMVHFLCQFGVFRLFQERKREHWNEYYAMRTDISLSGVPRAPITGIIPISMYWALVSIDERQASMSVTRAIRNALAITDKEAADVRNDMIRAGWVTNGRPPEITERGHALMG